MYITCINPCDFNPLIATERLAQTKRIRVLPSPFINWSWLLSPTLIGLRCRPSSSGPLCSSLDHNVPSAIELRGVEYSRGISKNNPVRTLKAQLSLISGPQPLLRWSMISGAKDHNVSYLGGNF